MNELSKLMKSMMTLLDSDIHLTGGVIRDTILPVNEQEWQQVASAGLKRQREYACGRYHGHRLLEALGITGFNIGRDGKGCPMWPDGVVGSISHTSNYCVVMLACKEKYISLGIDLEESGRMKKSLWPRLFTRNELDYLDSINDPAEKKRQAAILFSAKESFYKCDYPVSNKSYDFVDIEVSPGEVDGELQLAFTESGRQTPYKGHYVIGVTHVMTMVY